MSSQIIPVLALERCEIYTAQICALIHMESLSEHEEASYACHDEILHLVRSLNKDIKALKSVMG